MEFSIESFNPTKAELLALVEKSKGLVINGVDDTQGYQAVHKYRMELKNKRVIITKTGKEAREKALAFQKEVIAYEKELVSIIEVRESELQEQENNIDLQKEKLNRAALLPERKLKLTAINVDISDDEILSMDVAKFETFYNQKNGEFLQAKELKIKEDQANIDTENKRIADEKRIEEAKKEGEAKAKEQAIKDIELVKLKADQDKEVAIQAERDRQTKEQEVKAKDEADKIAKEQTEQKKLEGAKKYQKFLKDNGYTEENKQDFCITNQGSVVILYKKVGTLEI